MKYMKRFINFVAVIMICFLGITCSSSQNDDDYVDREKIIMVEWIQSLVR